MSPEQASRDGSSGPHGPVAGRTPRGADARETRERLLDAAERLFAAGGFEGTSLRAITAEAGVNLAAVSYHFGSKDGLVEAVFARRLEPLNAERLAALDALESGHGDRRLPVDGVVRALIEPPLALARAERQGGSSFMRLLGRTYSEPSPLIRRILGEQLREVAGRFRDAIGRALPELDEATIAWRLHFCIGAMAHVMADTFRLADLTAGRCNTADVDTAVRQLVPFLTAGLGAEGPSGRAA